MAHWYQGRDLIWGSDTNMPLSLDGISDYFRITDAAVGAPDVRKLPFILPFGAILWIWERLGIPYEPGLLQRVVIAGSLLSAGIGMLWLLRTFLPRLEILPAVAASLFYMFNLFAIITIWSPLSNLVFHYCILPLILVMWGWAFRRGSVIAGVLAGVVWCLTVTPSYITTPIVVTDFLLLIGILVAEYRLTPQPSDRRKLFAVAAAIAGVWFAGNAFWILPTLLYLDTESLRGLAVGEPANLVALNSVTLDKAIRLGGYWGLTSGYKGSPYFPWAGFYTHGYGAWASLLLPVVAVAGLRQLPRRPRPRYCPRCGRRIRDPRLGIVLCGSCGEGLAVRPISDRSAVYLKFFFVVLGVSILLMTGPNEPLGQIKALVMQRSEFFAPFRSVYQRFGEYAALAYAPVIAGGLQTVAWFVRRRLHRHLGAWWARLAAGGLAAVLVIALALPMWTGTLFDQSGVIPSKRVTIPPEYATVAQWIDERSGDFTVLTFPHGPSAVTALNWEEGEDGYLGVEPLQLLSSKPILFSDPSTDYLAGLAQQVSEGGDRAWLALRLLNARYVVVHLDANREYLAGLAGWAGIDTEEVVANLDLTENLDLALVRGGLRVYEFTEWKPFRVFKVPNYGGGSIYSLPFKDVRPVKYVSEGPGRYLVPSGQFTQGQFLVVNHPFDPYWRAGRSPLVSIAPGLTAFRVEEDGQIIVEHRLERDFPVLLALSPAGMLIMILLGFAVRRRHAVHA